MGELKINDIVNCRVTEVIPLGAKVEFLDKNNNVCNGFITVFEASWSIIKKANKLFKVGQELKAVITEKTFDEDECRYYCILSTKLPENNPWLKITHKIGDKVTGKIIWIKEKEYTDSDNKEHKYYIVFAEILPNISVLYETDNEPELHSQVNLIITHIDIENETIRGEETHG